MGQNLDIESNMDIDESKLNENWKEIRIQLVSNYRHCHIPLFANSGDARKNPEFIGSGFIASCDGKILAVTCGHVVDLLVGRALTTIDINTGNEMNLGGEILRHETLDIAIVNISGYSAVKIPEIGHLASNIADVDWMYVEGFPKKHNDSFLRDDSEWTPVGLRSRHLHRESNRASSFNLPFLPADLVGKGILEFDLTNFSEDDLVSVPKLFRPKMMSGSPVYVVDGPNTIYESPSEVVPKLVGVFIEHYEISGVALFVELSPTIENMMLKLTTDA